MGFFLFLQKKKVKKNYSNYNKMFIIHIQFKVVIINVFVVILGISLLNQLFKHHYLIFRLHIVWKFLI